jgi:hypothetical protein
MNDLFKNIFEGFHESQKMAIEVNKKAEESLLKPRKISQTSEVKRHLKNYKTITSKQAFEKYGCTRLSSMILRLRRQGWIIETMPTEGIDRYKTPTNYATYVLVSQPKSK